MYEKLKEVCEEILSDETKTKEFLLVSSIEEMYNFFKGKIPNLSTSEFDDFIAELLENYERMQLEGTTIDDEMLQNVSGGAKFGSKITAASLALLMGMPTGSVKAADGEATSLGSKIAQKAYSAVHTVGNFADKYSKKYNDLVLKIPILKKMPKTKKILEDYPYLAAIVSTAFIALVTVGGIAIHKHRNKSLTGNNVSNTITDCSSGGPVLFKDDAPPDELLELVEKYGQDDPTLEDRVIANLESRYKKGKTSEGEKSELAKAYKNLTGKDLGSSVSEEAARKEAEEEEKKKKEETARKRKEKEEKEAEAKRKKAEAERLKKEEETARKRKEKEEKEAEAKRKKAEAERLKKEEVRERAAENCQKLTTFSARVSERMRLEKLQNPRPVEKAMLDELRKTQKHDDDELERQVKSTVASYDTAEKRIQAIAKLTAKGGKKPNLAGQRVLEELRKTEAADREELRKESEQKQEQQKTVQRQAASEKVAAYQKQVDDLRAQAAAAQTRVSELQKELDQKRATMSQNRERIEQLENSLKGNGKKGQKSQWRADKSKTEEENKQLLEETTTLEAKLQEATSASEKAQQAYDKEFAKLTAAQRELLSF